MNAKTLIEFASKKGYAVSRYKSNIYEYGYNNGPKWICNRFYGTWNEFAKFMQDIQPATQPNPVQETTYYEEYKEAKQVICRSQYAVGFTVGKTYEVAEVVANRVQTEHSDKQTGTIDEFCVFIDIYMLNDNGNLANAAEPTDFEIVKVLPSRFALLDA